MEILKIRLLATKQLPFEAS